MFKLIIGLHLGLLITQVSFSQIMSEGGNYISNVAIRIAVKYTIENSTNGNAFISNYTIYNNKLRPVLKFNLTNDKDQNLIYINIKNIDNNLDSVLSYYYYTESGGLFIVDGNERDITINNTIIYDLLISFQDTTRTIMDIHTINSGLLNKGYYQLDQVSNKRIREHNEMIMKLQQTEEIVRLESIQILQLKQQEEKLRIAETERKRIAELKVINDFLINTRPNMILPNEAHQTCFSNCQEVAVGTLIEQGCINFSLNEKITLTIDTNGHVINARLNLTENNSYFANEFQENLLTNLDVVKFPVAYSLFNEKRYSVNSTFDYSLKVSSNYKTEKWKYKRKDILKDSTGSIVDDKHHSEFINLFDVSKYGVYEVGICHTQLNGAIKDSIFTVKKDRLFYQYISASTNFFPAGSLNDFNFMQNDSVTATVIMPITLSYIYHGIGLFFTFTTPTKIFSDTSSTSSYYFPKSSYFEGGLLLSPRGIVYLKLGMAYIERNRLIPNNQIIVAPSGLPKNLPKTNVAPIVGLAIYAKLINLHGGYNFQLQSAYLGCGLNIWYNR